MATVKRALSGVDVVIQSLGVSAGPEVILKPTRFFSKVTRLLVIAMEQTQVKRLISVTGRREHLNDDLHVVTLSKELIAAPPADLWPNVIRRQTVPADVEALLLTELEQ